MIVKGFFMRRHFLILKLFFGLHATSFIFAAACDDTEMSFDTVNPSISDLLLPAEETINPSILDLLPADNIIRSHKTKNKTPKIPQCLNNYYYPLLFDTPVSDTFHSTRKWLRTKELFEKKPLPKEWLPIIPTNMPYATTTITPAVCDL